MSGLPPSGGGLEACSLPCCAGVGAVVPRLRDRLRPHRLMTSFAGVWVSGGGVDAVAVCCLRFA